MKFKDDLLFSKDSHIKDLEKLKDDLIVSLHNAALSKECHIKDLQAKISELRDIIHVLKYDIKDQLKNK